MGNTRGSVVNHNYTRKSYNGPEGYPTFDSFYPFYLGEHCERTNRRLHLLGTTLSLGLLVYILLTGFSAKLLLLAIVQGYGFAWVGHFFFEKNKPATFSHPFYSFLGDMRMWWEVLMASFFRASCAIFWIVWITTFAYLIGISVYEAKYIFPHQIKEYQAPSNLVKGLCVVSIVYSILGCIFVKCDISHICCFLFYLVPLALILPGLSIYGIIATKNLMDNQGDLKFVTNATLLAKTVAHWKKANKQEKWLQQAELDFGCCGIKSWKDYTDKIYGDKPLMRPDNKSMIAEVPMSCCANNTGLKSGSHCLKNDIVITNTTVFGKNKLISGRGCGKYIISLHENAINAHHSFFIVIIICCFLMVVVYTKSWCDGRHFTGGHSQHSLDVETISVIDVPLEDYSQNSPGGGEGGRDSIVSKKKSIILSSNSAGNVSKGAAALKAQEQTRRSAMPRQSIAPGTIPAPPYIPKSVRKKSLNK